MGFVTRAPPGVHKQSRSSGGGQVAASELLSHHVTVLEATFGSDFLAHFLLPAYHDLCSLRLLVQIRRTLLFLDYNVESVMSYDMWPFLPALSLLRL